MAATKLELHVIALFEIAMDMEKVMMAKGMSKHVYELGALGAEHKDMIRKYAKQKEKAEKEWRELWLKEWPEDWKIVKDDLKKTPELE